MFAQFTHILALVAFTTHAVFGCCGHHEHAEPDELDGPQACQASPGDEQECESGRRVSEHGKHGCDSNTADGSVDSHAHNAPLSPCHHSHGCNEVRCTYLASSSTSVDWEAHCSSLPSIALCSSVVVDDLDSTHSGDFIGGAISSVGWPSAVRCALLQSWQI